MIPSYYFDHFIPSMYRYILLEQSVETEPFLKLIELNGLLPELFLGFSLMFLLFHSSLLASSARKKFPLINESLINLMLLILFLLFVLLNNSFCALSSSFCNNTIVLDNLAFNAKKLLIVLAALCFVLTKPYLKNQKINSFEYPLLVLFAIFGLMLLSSANDFMTAFLCIEIQGLSFYLLAAYKTNSVFSTEAGLKYFVLGAFSSSMFLFGSSIIYGCSGVLNLDDLRDLYLLVPANLYGVLEFNLIFLGLGFLLISLMFKLAIAPFHIWSPDIYENSLSSSTVFFAILPKISLFVFLLRVFYYGFGGFLFCYKPVFVCIGLVSVLIGSIVGLEVRQIKTLLAYSSISHMGYILLAFSTGSFESFQAIFGYLTIYLFSSICIWAIFVSLKLKVPENRKTNKDLSDFASLSKTNKNIALIFSIALLSLAGFPPLIGFYAKLKIFFSLINSTHFFAASVAIFCSVISTFYYIRIIKVLYFENKILENLYCPLSYWQSFLISIYFFCFIALFLDPSIFYLFVYKISLSSLII